MGALDRDVVGSELAMAAHRLQTREEPMTSTTQGKHNGQSMGALDIQGSAMV